LWNRALAADAGGDHGEERLDDVRNQLSEILEDQTGLHQTDASIDVVADAARRDDAVARVHRGDAADRKAVAPMDGGHCERIADDTGQMSHVHYLLEAVVFLYHGKKLLRRINPPRHSQAAGAGNF